MSWAVGDVITIYLPPADVVCHECKTFYRRFAASCPECLGTGRDPMPFSEVWGI